MLQDIPLDTKTISSGRLNITDKTRSNLFAWNGQFSPLLAQVLLKTYAKRGDFVADPFLGSGTVLVEAGRQNLPGFGSEINPAAFFMAQTYQLINLPLESRLSKVQELEEHLKTSFSQPNLFNQLVASSISSGSRARLIELWKIENDSVRKKLLETIIITSDFYADNFGPDTILSAWNRLTTTVKNLPYSKEPLTLSFSDARNLPLPNASVDLVLTSPPYINVFNYHQQYRASAEALGWDLLHVAKSEIGSNRKHRGNRFLTVIQYCLDMTQTLAELRRVCQPDARLVLVVGRESNVSRTRFYNSDIVSRTGVYCVGLLAEKRQERVFTNRFGTAIVEDIIHFRVASATPTLIEPLVIAEDALCSAYNHALPEVKPAIQDAIDKLEMVKPSPLFQDVSRKEGLAQ
jgi:hypothetical protein